MYFIPASGKAMMPEKIWDMAATEGKMVKKQSLTNTAQAYWTLIMEKCEIDKKRNRSTRKVERETVLSKLLTRLIPSYDNRSTGQ